MRKTTKHCLVQREAVKLAEERRQIRFEFLSVLAHELKTPLAAVEGNLIILREHLTGPGGKVCERLVDRSLLRLEGMRKLIFDLLDLTRIESGQKQRFLVDVDVRAIAHQSMELHEAPARLFGELVRIKNRKTMNILWSGLGLSILRRLALLCGGHVVVESEPDQGSCFTVTLQKGTPAGTPAPQPVPVTPRP